MRSKLLSLILFAILLPAAKGQSLVDPDGTERVTSVGNIGLTVSNIGIIGNSFRGNFTLNGWPSCEFPVNSGIEHLFEGGPWVGGMINGSQVAVTTGAVDASSGYSPGLAGFEFSAPVGGRLDERSSLFDSPYYNPLAISHQDFFADFADTSFIIPGTSIQILNHDYPMGMGVHMETYAWNYSFANFFVIIDLTIKNVGNDVIEEPYVGFWMDGVVRNVNITFPSGSAFFNKGGNGYIDTLFLGYEFDAAGDLGFTESYIGLKYLGSEDKNGFRSPKLDTAFKVNYNTWQFQNAADPLYFFPTTDNARFAKMENGLNYRSDFNTNIRNQIRTASNRSTLVAAGPYAPLNPGDEVKISFAVVCAKKKEDGNPNSDDTDPQKEGLITNALWAQTAYFGEDINGNGVLDQGEDRDQNGVITRYILPSPPDIPGTHFVAGNHSIEVYWNKKAQASVDPISNRQDFEGYRLYKSKVGFDVQDKQDLLESLKLVAEFDQSGNGLFYDTGFDEVELDQPATFDGDTTRYYYKYVFNNLQDGWQHVVALTAFDQGDAANNLQSLESASLSNLKRIFPGKPANDGFAYGDPYVYPNPYYAGASWEGSSGLEEDRKIVFANLPSNCTVRIYTVAGDFVDSFDHTAEYKGDDIRWFSTYSDPTNTQFSGGEHGWDLLSKDNQIIARGIYLFSVEDKATGKKFQGKFVVIK